MKLNTQHVTENTPFWNDINRLAKEAFPPEEYLAPAELLKMSKAENFDFLMLTDNVQFVGFMVVQTYQDMAYLFFLAIDPSVRSKGYGSLAIKCLKELYPNKTQVVDFEMLDEKAENFPQRQKRRTFYLKNGYNETGLFLSYLGVDYEVFCMGENFNSEKFKEMMSTIQVDGFNPKYFSR